MAAEEIADLVAVDAKLTAMKVELRAAVRARGSGLMDLFALGPATAARILSDVGDVARFPDRNHFASWTGTAPLGHLLRRPDPPPALPGRGRRLNHVLHIAAIVQIRQDTEGRAYYRRKLAESKTPMEALRCLKRRISDAVYRQLLTDAQAAASAGPGGHSASSQSSAADLSTPVIGSSDQPLPEPARPTLPATRPPAKTHADPVASRPRRRAGAVKVQRPTGRTTLTATSAGAHSPRPRARAIDTEGNQMSALAGTCQRSSERPVEQGHQPRCIQSVIVQVGTQVGDTDAHQIGRRRERG
jgi:transposase